MERPHPSVSVLMAVYRRDDPSHFADALDSLRPFVERLDAVILVADGPLTSELEIVIQQRVHTLKILPVRLSQSVGLAGALNAGLNQTGSDYLLRMDADDLCRAERLEVLLERLAEDPRLDVVGSYISEFGFDPARPQSERRVPLDHAEIARRMRTRCVMNHVSCLIRRRSIMDAGGYVGNKNFAEDWWLWARMLSNGARFGNVGHVLVDVRVGNGFISRRRGYKMLREDIRLIYMMRKIGFMRGYQVVGSAIVKLLQRLMPATLLHIIYRLLRHPSTTNG